MHTHTEQFVRYKAWHEGEKDGLTQIELQRFRAKLDNWNRYQDK